MTLAMLIGLVGAFILGYLRGERNGTDQTRTVCQASVELERARCRRDQLGALYGSDVIARPSMAGRN